MQFQFTPLREGRRVGGAEEHARTRFQFTPLREGRQYTSFRVHNKLRFQFTPLREGRPLFVVQYRGKGVSIHAPA